MFRFSALPPLSLYLHVPWCVRKCPYCDFNSHEARGPLPEREYVDALLRDLEQDLPRIWGRPIVSVFIGGGTPSLLSAEALDRLLSGLRALLKLAPDVEVTLEANPGTAEQAKFSEFRAAGVNRLSIGAQSFDDGSLQRIGRIHGRREAVRAAEMAHAAGYENFNLDLMYGLPNQSPAQAEADLRTALDLEPTHLSYYQLTLEPNTWFYRHPPPLPEDEALWAMHSQGVERLAERGYAQYEVSAYAQAGRQCQHNLNYWRFGDYLGIGAGAHGKITDAREQAIVRLCKARGPDDYLARVAEGTHVTQERRLGREEAPLEFMMNALRLNGGFETALFSERVGLPITVVEAPLRAAEERGLIEWALTDIRPTERGRLFLNDLLGLFVPAQGEGEEEV
ncbi:oxygen-independent coproporphyrinogen III oxidase-like protein [Ectothiorhodospiraceae bacterium 2226]|nr:oxygen-independent coproporphyrinogen III oxidase-like protein [Ectothiorhodospiraceae bacterium 2226]